MFWSQKIICSTKTGPGFKGLISVPRKSGRLLVGPKHVSDTSGQDDMYVCICVFI